MAANKRPDAEDKDALVKALDEAEPVVAQEPDRTAPREATEDVVPVDEAVIAEDAVTADATGATDEGALAGTAEEPAKLGDSNPEQPSPPLQQSQPLPPPPVPQDSGKQGGFVGVVVGGIIAAAIGYGVAIYAPLGGASDVGGQIAALKTEATSLGQRVAAVESAPAPVAGDPALEARVAALESAPAATTTAPVDLAPVQAQLGAIEDRLTAFEGRLASLETRPDSGTGGSGVSAEMEAALAALRDEVAALKGAGAAATADIEAMAAEAQARLAEAEAQAAQMKAEAEATAQKALARAGLGRVQAALESGSPFESALADLGGIEVPAVLRDTAAEGIPSRAGLIDAFPAAARAALEASLRANTGESWSERMGAFLQSTTGARSLTPREGNDPDAILSRAEASLKADDLTAALAEIASLPPEGQAALADWVAEATKRQDAAQAVADLSTAIDG